MARDPHWSEARANGADLTFVGLRVAVGGILIWGALTKLLGGERIGELAQAWGAAGLPQPQILVTASMALQLVLALLLLIGLFTRTAGLLNGVNFAVGAALTGIFTSGSNWWPFALLIALLLHFALRGPGRLSIDRARSRRLANPPMLADSSLEDLLVSIGIKPQPGDGNYPGQSG